jgi:uncharacterized protein YoaH (UPF0181 family)
VREAEHQPWRAAIHNPDGRVVGAGFLVDQQHVLTCAHVVADALGVAASGPRPHGRVLVGFPAVGLAEPLPADVHPDGWTPIGADDRGDVAVLVLQVAPPPGTKPAPLRQPSGLAGHRISTFGYPRKVEYGEWAHGVASGPGGPGGQWVQLDAPTVTGRRIERGFSGAAVYDHTADGVVGMVVAEDTQAEAKIAWMLPTAVLAASWPSLVNLLPSLLRLDPAFRSHWQPRGRGVDWHRRPGWYFTGRTQVLRELVAWLHAPPESDPKARVVTGGPGSGKSAVLARLVTLADPTTRAEVPVEVLADAAEGTIPDPRSIEVAVHAAGKTTTDIAAAIAEATGCAAGSPEQLLDELLDRGGPLTIVLDALDEATDAAQLIRTLLQQLAFRGGQMGIRLLVGSRRELLSLLRAGCQVLDLDDPGYHQRDDLAGYVERILTGAGDPAADTPYQHDHRLAATVAEAVAARADPSFLIAQLVALDLADRPEPVDTSRPDWQAQFPATVAAAMDGYLARYGPDQQRITDLLLPLAWAQGAGLADDQLWAELATALGTADYHDYNVRLVRDTTIGTLLQATDTEDGPAYRLFHEALAEHLRSGRFGRDAHRAYTRSLLTRTPTRAGGQQPDWGAASGYTRAHLAVHAAYAGQLDQLLADPAFLLHADLDRLLGVLRHVTSSAGRQVAGTIQRASHHLRARPLDERAAYLQLTARQHGDTRLAEALDYTALDLAWRTPWAFWRAQAPHRVMGYHHGLSTRAFAVTTLPDGQAIAITGSHDGTIRLWDLQAGTPRTDPLPAHQSGLGYALIGGVQQLATTTLSTGQAIAITGSDDGTIRLWDLQARAPLTDPLPAHQPRGGYTFGGGVQQLATTTLPNGQAIAITAGDDGTIRLWDLQARVPLTDPLPAHKDRVQQLATTTLPNGQAIAITAGDDGTIRLWDLQARVPLTDPLPAHKDRVQQLATTTLSTGQVIAITGSDDGTIRLWDLQARAPLTDPLPAHQPRDVLRGGVQQLATTTLPNGQAIAITAGGERVCTYDLSAGRIWRQVNIGSQVRAMALLPDGLVVVGTQMGLLGLRDVLPGTK